MPVLGSLPPSLPLFLPLLPPLPYPARPSDQHSSSLASLSSSSSSSSRWFSSFLPSPHTPHATTTTLLHLPYSITLPSISFQLDYYCFFLTPFFIPLCFLHVLYSSLLLHIIPSSPSSQLFTLFIFTIFKSGIFYFFFFFIKSPANQRPLCVLSYKTPKLFMTHILYSIRVTSSSFQLPSFSLLLTL